MMNCSIRPARPLSRLPRLSTGFVLTALCALAACGGGDDSAPAAPAAASPAPTAPAAFSTTVTGAVVKGPVSGAQVCAYTVVANARGAALGSCTTSDTGGNYSFAVPVGTGPLWVEATGGSYTDEATGASATLPAGSPLRSIITANAGTVNTMLTPLTTLALNSAAATVGTGGTLDAAAFGAAAAQLLSTFNLPATLNITGTLPAFGSGANSYGAALAVISQMVANGTTLASILGTSNPQALAVAYATAAAPPVTPPVSPPPPTSGGSPSASGSLTVTGTTAAGAATSLAPQADGFEVAVDETTTRYRFYRESGSPLSKVEVTLTVTYQGISVSYYDLAARTTINSCTANCDVSITRPSGATHPLTVAFANTALSGGLRLNGSLVGDAPGAVWTPGELPRTTGSALTVGGASVAVDVTSDDIVPVSGTASARSITMHLADGSVVGVTQQTGAEVQVTRSVLPASTAYCFSACGVTLASTATSTRVTFNNTTLSGGLVIDGTVDMGKTTGTLTSSDLGSITPTVATIKSLNDKRTLTFSVLGTASQAGLSLITVEVQNGRVISGAATVGIAGQVFNCFDNGSAIGVPTCTGLTVAADGRSVTFSNVVMNGGAVGTARRNVTFNGNLVAKGS